MGSEREHNPWLPARHLFRAVRRRYYIVILAVAVTTGGAILYLKQQTPLYRARARVLIEPRRSRFSGAEGETTNPMGYFFLKYELQTQITIIKSRAVAERVFEKLGLRDVERFKGLPNPVAAIAGMVSAEPLGDTRFIDISCLHEDPEWAAKLANAFAEAYIAENIAHRKRLINEAVEAYSSRFLELHEKLEKAEAELLRFQEEELVVSSDRPEEALRLQEAELLQDLAQARRERVAAQARLMSFSETAESGGLAPGVASDDPWMRELLDARLSQNAIVMELSKSFSEGHPKLESAKARLLEIEKEIEQASSAYRERLQRAYEAARWKEQEISRFLAEHRAELARVKTRLGRYEALRQRRDSLKALLDPLARGQAELDLAASLDLANATLWDPAVPPRSPSEPRWFRYLALALASGLIIGLWLASFLEGLDEALISQEDLEKAAPVQLVAAISSMGRASHSSPLRAFSGGRDLQVLAEQFRSLRTGILSLRPDKADDHKGAIFMVTSPGLGDGKTTVSVNAAEACAQLGRATVIIDADMRRPQVHSAFGIPKEPGLAEFLEGKSSLEEVLKPAGPANLWAIPGGGRTSRPAELVASAKTAELLDELRRRFEVIWLDTPPVMLVAEARTLAPKADLIVLVVRSGHTPRRAVSNAWTLLGGPDGARMVAVLNGVTQSVEKENGYYYGRYRKYYSSQVTDGPS